MKKAGELGEIVFSSVEDKSGYLGDWGYWGDQVIGMRGI